MTTEPDVFQLAERAISAVVAKIEDDRWDMTMPASFSMRREDHVPSLREIVNYHAYDDAWVPDMLAGLTMEEAGKDKFDGDLLGKEPKTAFARIVDTACASAARVRDLDAAVHCSFGDYTVREYFWQINSFRGLRAHDIASVIGVDADLPQELVQGIWDEVSPRAEEWRGLGVLPAAVPVSSDAPLLDRLLGLTGRAP